MHKLPIPDHVLLTVQKPARYIGGEINSVQKDLSTVHTRFCFCFPDVYDVGMSHLGLQILYACLNSYEGVYCERSFAPWPDMEQKLRDLKVPLYSLETFTPLRDFDFVGFTLQYEMSYTNILNMLDLGGIPVFAKDRGEEDPIVIAGGPNANNPEPLADFIDLYYIGEGEVEYGHLFDLYQACQKEGWSRETFLRRAARIPGMYVPRFYEVTYEEAPAEGCLHTPRLSSIKPIYDDLPEKVTKVTLKDIDSFPYPEKPIVPLMQTIFDRASMEIFRGCIHGCRFCNAGMIYRPVRFHSREVIMKWVDAVLASTGYDEISLTSLSSNDYPNLYTLLEEIHEKYPNVQVSLPSLRVDAFSLKLMEELSEGKKSGLTFASEAGTQRLRDVINKNITEEEILSGVSLAFQGKWDRVKLYFMLGLPTETDEDVTAIAALGEKIYWQWKKLPPAERSRDVAINISTSFFVPKPFTPFQWCAQASDETFYHRQNLLRDTIRNRKIEYHCHDAFLSTLEGLLARGDRRIGALIYEAWRLGCTFDGWSDMFKEELWRQAIENTGTEMAFYNYRERKADEVFPWDHIDCGVTKDYMYQEYLKAKKAETTPSCLEKCTNCGTRKICPAGVCTGEIAV